MKPLISVIMPIYKVENYLKRAVDSVLCQTYRNLDIILVDDGSPDQCGAICDAYERREARVRVIHKENGGLSDARNAGLAVAGGDYIAFLDSDDFYAPRFIEILYEQLMQNEAQIAVCTYEVTKAIRVDRGPKFAEHCRQYDEGKTEIACYDRAAMLKNQYDAAFQDATYFIVAWNKLYKASLWKDIRFPKGKIHEDEATIYKIFDRAERCVYVKLPLYAYFTMPDSITRQEFNLKRLDWIEALDDRIRFFEEKQETELLQLAVRARADAAIRFYRQLSEYVKDAKKEKKMLQGCVREALALNRSRNPALRGFLQRRTRLGYRLFLLKPELFFRMIGDIM